MAANAGVSLEQNPYRQSALCSAGWQTDPVKEAFVLRHRRVDRKWWEGKQTHSGRPMPLDMHTYTNTRIVAYSVCYYMPQHCPFKHPYFIFGGVGGSFFFFYLCNKIKVTLALTRKDLKFPQHSHYTLLVRTLLRSPFFFNYPYCSI